MAISERRDHRLACFAHRALYSIDSDWPAYLQLKQYLLARTLRSSDALQLAVPKDAGTFQYTCAKVFNSLRADTRNTVDRAVSLQNPNIILLLLQKIDCNNHKPIFYSSF